MADFSSAPIHTANTVEHLMLAKPRGFCAGVVMAIGAVEKAARSEAGPLTVYHSIVHNHTVVERLEQDHRVHFVEDLDILEALPDGSQTLVFSAHGVSPQVRQRAANWACPPSTPPARWSPKCIPRPRSTPARATPSS